MATSCWFWVRLFEYFFPFFLVVGRGGGGKGGILKWFDLSSFFYLMDKLNFGLMDTKESELTRTLSAKKKKEKISSFSR